MFKAIGLALPLSFGVITNSYAFVAKPIENIAISPSDIYTVVATPIEANSSYKLELFREGRDTAMMTATQPLDDQIIDIIIDDVDHDGKEELVVFMTEDSPESQKLHFDVFKFERNKLNLVENFSNPARLLSMLNIAEIKN